MKVFKCSHCYRVKETKDEVRMAICPLCVEQMKLIEEKREVKEGDKRGK